MNSRAVETEDFNTVEKLPSPWLVRCYAALVLALPWSVEWPFGASALLFPAEPLLAVAGLCLFRAWQKTGFRRLKINALLLIVLLWAGWLTVCAAASTMPRVSWKYWLVEMAHLWVFCFGMALFPGLWRRVLPFFAGSLAGVAVYALVRHGWFFHFRTDQSMLAPMPFFGDHTVWGAVLGLAGLAVGAWWYGARGGNVRGWKKIGLAILLIFALALFLTFSRAAWLSVTIAGATGLLLILPQKWRWTSLSLLAATALCMFFSWKNTTAQLADDVSGRERLNRYSCAARMGANRPWTGFGPGTFAFQYLAYQKPEEMTRISVTAPIARRGPDNYGRGGGAHSEYFQAWAELGAPGLALWVTLVGATLATGLQRFFAAKTKADRWFALLTTLGLLTFFLHGLVNNFLHDARVGVLVWGQVGVLLLGRR